MFGEKPHKKRYPTREYHHGFIPGRHHLPGMFRPLMSMSKESFLEMREYFILKILTDIPEGITGYQFQEEYHFPRTNVLRLLDKLEKDELVTTKEEIVDGRTNKLYLITEKGIKQMEELKEKWGERFRMMSDTTIPFFTRGERFHLMNKVNELANSEDATDYFRGLRSKIKNRQTVLEDRLNNLNEIRKELDTIINMIERDTEFDKEKIINHIKDWWERTKENREDK